MRRHRRNLRHTRIGGHVGKARPFLRIPASPEPGASSERALPSDKPPLSAPPPRPVGRRYVDGSMSGRYRPQDKPRPAPHSSAGSSHPHPPSLQESGQNHLITTGFPMKLGCFVTLLPNNWVQSGIPICGSLPFLSVPAFCDRPETRSMFCSKMTSRKQDTDNHKHHLKNRRRRISELEVTQQGFESAVDAARYSISRLLAIRHLGKALVTPHPSPPSFAQQNAGLGGDPWTERVVVARPRSAGVAPLAPPVAPVAPALCQQSQGSDSDRDGVKLTVRVYKRPACPAHRGGAALRLK